MNKIEKLRDIYYEYLYLKDLDIKYYLVNIDNEELNLLIPSEYNIKYTKSTGNYIGIGHINFYNEKNKFVFDYAKQDYQVFKYYISNLNKNITKHFTNYRGQEIYEVVKDNIDHLYMYYNGYMFRITSKNKLSINEYFDMYVIFYSITNSLIIDDLKLLKEISILREQGLYCFCNDEDLLIRDLSNYNSDIVINKENIVITNDDKYLEYKEKRHKIDLITNKVLANTDIQLLHEDNKWLVVGMIHFGCLGYYNNVFVNGYQEITTSEELDDKEKNKLLEMMIKQRQIEIESYNDKIFDEFIKYLTEYLINNLNYDSWNKYHFREFINIDKINVDEDLNDDDIYDLFMSYLLDNYPKNSDYKTIFNYQKIIDSIKGEELIICPDQFKLTFSGCNYLLNSQSIIVSELYSFNY